MGDAGPQTPITVQGSQSIYENRRDGDITSREVNILVTGFGPFKSFATNPSFMIATSLPDSITPTLQAKTAGPNRPTSLYKPIRRPNNAPYRIRIHTHPEPVWVAYSSTATDIPKLIARGPPNPSLESSSSPVSSDEQHATYDYVFHIGMAAGRDNYTLETLAHRDHYKIKDVIDRDGFISGEHEWKRQHLPEALDVGWHKEDVLARWELLTSWAEDELEAQQQWRQGKSATTMSTTATSSNPTSSSYTDTPSEGHTLHEIPLHFSPPHSKRAEVKLSKDAGRFLCEFILYTSLAYRFREAAKDSLNSLPHGGPPAASQDDEREEEPAGERLGKIAFLHVPGGITPADIDRGTLVAEAAIKALVGSWEEGYRNEDVYEKM